MLHFIIGTAGTGKTTLLADKIKETAKAGKRSILIVPEQLSFESERAVFRALGPKDSLSVEVLSFTRLCDNIFRVFGGLSGFNLTKTAKYLLMSIAVEETGENLRTYKKSSVNIAFLQTALSACSEFKSAGIVPERLSSFAKSCGDTVLSEKLGDLATLYGAYQALLENGYADPEDCLIRASSVLAENDYFSDYTVFIDGFTAFMAGEYAILRHAVAHSPDVWLALTADSPYDEKRGMGLFSPVQAVIRRLSDMARQSGAGIEKYHILEEPRRFVADDLRCLSKRFMEPSAPSYNGEAPSISVYSASDAFDEAEQAAASISALVRESGLRYREIAVVARETEPYLRPLELAFSRYGIPFFADDPEDIENMPLTGAVLAALDAVNGSFDTRHILMLAKSPVMGLDVESAAELENYAYIWNIKGALWREAFANNPRGLAEGLTEEDTLRLGRVNKAREAVIEPLIALREIFRGGTGGDFARGIYDFLVGINAASNLTEYSKGLPVGERDAFLDENARLWDVLIDILDLFGQLLGSKKVPLSRLCGLFRLAAASAEAATPPQTLDQVIVGKADRIRPVNIRAAFILGANEGVFPPEAAPAGVFSDNERRAMIDAGLEISSPSLNRVVLERFFAYFALTLPSERLYVSCRVSDLNGREALPSVIVTQLQSLFPSLGQTSAEGLSRVQNADTAFSVLAGAYTGGSGLTASLREFFTINSPDRLNRLERAASKPPHRIADPAAARALFGKRMRLSPSRVERYYRCPFSYFAEDGLGLKKRRRVEFSPIESGSAAHHVLHVMVRRYGGRGLDAIAQKQLEDEIREVLNEYISARLESESSLPARFRYLLDRLCGTLARLLKHMGEEFAQGKFDPAAFELPIRLDAETKPLVLKTAGGETIAVEGIVDRVDVMTSPSGKKYVRVVDYKSGKKDFKLQDILYGLNMQMLLYLFTVKENGLDTLGGAIPAGVLYVPVREAFINADRNASGEEIAAERRKSWRMSGLLLEDEEALRGMEEKLAGVYIPVKFKKDGAPDSASPLISLTRMGKLSQKVMELTAMMASSLTNGEIASRPVDSPDYNVCANCDYRAVCGFEEGDEVRSIAKLDREKALKMLDGEPWKGE